MAEQLTIDFEPEYVELDDPAEAATWGRLTVRAGRHVLTRVLDRYANFVRTGVDGTVLPLAEWLARNWTGLTSTVWPPPPKSDRLGYYEWRRTHEWRMTGQGMALPDVRLWRNSRDEFTLTVRPDDAPLHERVDFLSRTKLQLPVSQVVPALAGFVDMVARRCHEAAPENQRTVDLLAEWSMATDRASTARAAGRLAAMAGLSWAHLPEPDRDLLARTVERHSVAELGLFYSLQPRQLGDAEALLEAALNAVASASPAGKDLVALKGQLASSKATRAWKRGWEDANSLRTCLKLPNDKPSEPGISQAWFSEDPVSSLAVGRDESVLGWHAGRFPQRLSGYSAGGFRAFRDGWAPLFAGPCDQHHLVSLAQRGGYRSVANAFATELLAPVAAVRTLLAGRAEVGWEEVQEAGVLLNAPFMCIQHQVENHQLAVLNYS